MQIVHDDTSHLVMTSRTPALLECRRGKTRTCKAPQSGGKGAQTVKNARTPHACRASSPRMSRGCHWVCVCSMPHGTRPGAISEVVRRRWPRRPSRRPARLPRRAAIDNLICPVIYTHAEYCAATSDAANARLRVASPASGNAPYMHNDEEARDADCHKHCNLDYIAFSGSDGSSFRSNSGRSPR